MIDAYASAPHYADHIRPVFEALPDRGRWLTEPTRSDRPVIVASQHDLAACRAQGRRVVLMEHGAGQSYGGVRGVMATHSAYPGGTRRDAALFLSPNYQAAMRDLAAYPNARVEVIGNPMIASLPTTTDGPVAVSFHWNGSLCPEVGWAFDKFRDAIASLAQNRTVLGHGHPRVFDRLRGWYERHGIEPVESFADVCARASIYVCDNSSTLYEFAATDRPVVVLNSPRYRREVRHGLRFWDCADVGPQVDQPAQLADAIDLAPSWVARRRATVARVFPYTDPSRAVDVLTSWINGATRSTEGDVISSLHNETVASVVPSASFQ